MARARHAAGAVTHVGHRNSARPVKGVAADILLRARAMRLRPVAAVAVGVTVAACGYRAGTFEGPRGSFVGERVTVGCLDVAVTTHADADAVGPVIAYEFGNRCDHPSTVDLAAVRVRGRTAAGDEVALVAYDPRGELRAARLEARRTGREVIEYRAPGQDVVQLACVELELLDDRPGDAREICVGVGRGQPTERLAQEGMR